MRSDYLSSYWNNSLLSNSAGHTKTRHRLVLSRPSLRAVAVTYFSHHFASGLTLLTSNVYINRNVSTKIELKIESLGKWNCDFDLEAILAKVAILTSMSEKNCSSFSLPKGPKNSVLSLKAMHTHVATALVELTSLPNACCEQILALIQEPLPDQRNRIVTMQLWSLLPTVRPPKLSVLIQRRLPVKLNNQLMNCRWITGPRSTPELSRELRRGAGSHSWRPRPSSRSQVPTARLLAMQKKGCVVTEESRWWTVLPKCCGHPTKLPETAVTVWVTVDCKTWSTFRS